MADWLSMLEQLAIPEGAVSVLSVVDNCRQPLRETCDKYLLQTGLHVLGCIEEATQALAR